jgi:hypothetical protein
MYTRRPKESHRDTVTYEIDMLDFSARKARGEYSDAADKEVYLEGFLLHYRNVIRFCSGEYHREDKGDLSLANSRAWSDRDLTPTETVTIREAAKTLDAKYHKAISQYLQHITRVRSDQDRDWDLELMTIEIAPIISAFERAFPR